MSSSRDELLDLVAGFRAHLATRARQGVVGVPAAPSPRRGAPPSATPRASSGESPEEAEAAPGQFPQLPPGAPGLDAVRAALGDCQRCKLAPKRKNIVFGVGDPAANLMFVGEAPGADEDEQGEPFVGAAGQLLTKMIKAMGYDRSQVYICNILKCRPPQNRNPEPDEVAACSPFLPQQIAVVQPRVIVALGKFAAQYLCGESTPISRLRGNWRTYREVPVMPTYHPAYLLRDESKKGEAWSDLKQVIARLTQIGAR
jgi:uracil-DNA glycosylase family 4